MLPFDKFVKWQNSHLFQTWVFRTFGKWSKRTGLNQTSGSKGMTFFIWDLSRVVSHRIVLKWPLDRQKQKLTMCTNLPCAATIRPKQGIGAVYCLFPCYLWFVFIIEHPTLCNLFSINHATKEYNLE